MRMNYRNRREALHAWRASVRDAAVLALAMRGESMPIAELAASLGVDVGALFGLLVNDKRFRMDLADVPRAHWGTRMARFVALIHHQHLSPPSQVPQACKTR